MSKQLEAIKVVISKMTVFKADLISMRPAYEDSPKDYYIMSGKISAIDTCIEILKFEIENKNNEMSEIKSKDESLASVSFSNQPSTVGEKRVRIDFNQKGSNEIHLIKK